MASIPLCVYTHVVTRGRARTRRARGARANTVRGASSLEPAEVVEEADDRAKGEQRHAERDPHVAEIVDPQPLEGHEEDGADDRADDDDGGGERGDQRRPDQVGRGNGRRKSAARRGRRRARRGRR